MLTEVAEVAFDIQKLPVVASLVFAKQFGVAVNTLESKVQTEGVALVQLPVIQSPISLDTVPVVPTAAENIL